MGNNTEREMRTVTTFNASAALMWTVWTEPEHLVNWWGPNGFKTTIHQMDFQEGGEWRLTLHGPDGTDFANRSIFKNIEPFKEIVFEHFNPHFITTVIFEPVDDETIVDWTLLFDTAEMHDIIVKTHKADKGQQENLDKLEAYLKKLREQV